MEVFSFNINQEEKPKCKEIKCSAIISTTEERSLRKTLLRRNIKTLSETTISLTKLSSSVEARGKNTNIKLKEMKWKKIKGSLKGKMSKSKSFIKIPRSPTHKERIYNNYKPMTGASKREVREDLILGTTKSFPTLLMNSIEILNSKCLLKWTIINTNLHLFLKLKSKRFLIIKGKLLAKLCLGSHRFLYSKKDHHRANLFY